jgi:hypothetical protein
MSRRALARGSEIVSGRSFYRASAGRTRRDASLLIMPSIPVEGQLSYSQVMTIYKPCCPKKHGQPQTIEGTFAGHFATRRGELQFFRGDRSEGGNC